MAESYVLRKRFTAPVDLKKPIPIRSFEVVEGDTGNEIEVILTDGGEPVDMTGHYVVAVFSHSGGVACISGEDGVAAEGNRAVISLSPDAFSSGMVECELQIYSSTEGPAAEFAQNDILVTTARFNFNCRKAILNGESIECEPHFPLLTELISAVSDAEAARQEAEGGRAAAEQMRVLAENGRVLAEDARAQAELSRAGAELSRTSAELSRAGAEAERAQAETERAQAEAEREQAEAEREAAEARREADLAAHMAQNGLGVLAGEAPTSSTQGEAGRLRFDTAAGGLYVCRPQAASWQWTELAAATPWVKIREYTLPEDVSVIEFTNIGGSRMPFTELRVTCFGEMKNSAAGALRLNGSSTGFTFSALMNTDTMVSTNPVAIIDVCRESAETLVVKRYYGGVSAGSVSTKNVFAGVMKDSSPINSLTIAATAANGLFKQGMRIVLERR